MHVVYAYVRTGLFGIFAVLDMKSGEILWAVGSKRVHWDKEIKFMFLFLLSQTQQRETDLSVFWRMLFLSKALVLLLQKEEILFFCQWIGRRSVKAESNEERKSIWSGEEVCMEATYQVSVDDRILFQISHSFAHIQAHSQEGFFWKTAPLAPEVVRQAAVLHELEH